ncbi:MAG TPA: nucleotidyltransferase family protein, partial [Gemmatimonadaceae bacterium]
MNKSREAVWHLMLVAARQAAGVQDDLAELREAASDVDDWPEAVRMAREHGLLVLLGRNVIAAHVSSSALLTDAVRHELDRSLAHVRVLREVAGILSDAGVDVLVFKGPVLSLRLYGDAATRISADLDLVVARRDYTLARRILLTAGFSPRNGHSAWREEHLFRWLGHASFHRNGTDVELHWRFSPIQF